MAVAGARACIDFMISPIMKKLLADPTRCLGVDMVSELHELEINIMPQFALLTEAANKGPHRAMLEKWTWQLQEAFYKAEDLLDEHEYNILKREAENRKDSSLEHTSSSNAIMKHIHTVSSRLSNLRPKNKKLLDQLKELKLILAKAKDFRDLLCLTDVVSAVPTAVIRVATSIPPPKVIGRDKDRDDIIDLLTKPIAIESDTSSVIETLPSNAALLGNCSSLRLENVPNLKALPSLPASLEELAIEKCMLLIFISSDELKQHDQREDSMMAYNLNSRLSVMWEADSESEIKEMYSVGHIKHTPDLWGKMEKKRRNKQLQSHPCFILPERSG
ncbi:hypothetical protein ZWY2020_016253 [Hordeum vulgare]|nr:hypothetical protein ZWY2020_016253 [Hordeum vulgare]